MHPESRHIIVIVRIIKKYDTVKSYRAVISCRFRKAISIAQIPLGQSQHNTVWPVHFGTGKVVTCCVSRQAARHAVTTSASHARCQYVHAA